MPRSYGMISQETNQNLINLMYSPTILAKLYTEFLGSEANCAKDVHTFLQNYTKLAIQKTGMLDETEEMESEDFFDIIEASNELTKILMTVFTTGMMYGKSMFYDEFAESFKDNIADDKKDDNPSTEIF